MPGFRSAQKITEAFLNIRRGLEAPNTIEIVEAHATAMGDELQSLSGDQTALSFLTSPTTLAIASESTDDTDGGIGAEEVRVELLDSSLEVQTQTVTLNGQTEVTIPGGPYIRIVRCYVTKTGGTGFDKRNLGQIHIGLQSDTWTDGVPDQPLFGVEALWSTSLCGLYTVPAGKVAFATHAAVTFAMTTGSPNKAAIVFFEQRSAINDVWYRIDAFAMTAGFLEKQIPSARPMLEGDDLRIIGAVDSGGGGEILVNLTLFLEDAP